MLAKNIFCRDLSLRNGEKLPGTAGPRSTWILIQDHSPWAINAFDDCALNNAVKDYLRQLFAFEKPTILLIRNSDNKVIDQRKLFVVRSIEKQPSLHEFNWRTADDILQLPLAEAIAGQDVGRFDKPLYLVCTHGKRDKCCAKYGTPVFKQ
jgi:hypothetical protein